MRLSDKKYTKLYYEYLTKSCKDNKKEWVELLAKEKIIIISDSYYYEFADRVLLAKFLEKYNAEYKGEIEI